MHIKMMESWKEGGKDIMETAQNCFGSFGSLYVPVLCAVETLQILNFQMTEFSSWQRCFGHPYKDNRDIRKREKYI